VLEIDVGAGRPEMVAKLLASDDIARTLEHQPEDFERLLLQPHARRACAQLPQPEIQLERSELQGSGGFRGFHVPLCPNDVRLKRAICSVLLTIGP
jgi:hypothetical protein